VNPPPDLVAGGRSDELVLFGSGKPILSSPLNRTTQA
jgi:hypothetical protein